MIITYDIRCDKNGKRRNGIMKFETVLSKVRKLVEKVDGDVGKALEFSKLLK